MKKDYGHDDWPAIKAKFEAQKIAFAPVMFQAARVLRELGILKALQDGGKEGAGPEEIAGSLGLSRYGVEVLLDAGLSMGICRMKEEKYILTKTGHFILNDPLTIANMDFVHHVCYQPFFSLEESIVSGKPEGLRVFGPWETIYPAVPVLPEKARESWYRFDHYYSDIVFPEVMPLIFSGKPATILDVGGNVGKFALMCAAYDPEVVVTIVDLPETLALARENAEAAGMSGRIRVEAADMLDPASSLPGTFDVIWMSQFLDCFSETEILDILQRAVKAMHPDSFLYILELFWDRQKYEASAYSLNATSLYFTCIANGNSRMYHSEDFLRLVSASGLVVEEITDQLGVSHTLLKCRTA
jgi:ubiquinone/menaquinone biosynthesis C-methylase UbiE